MSAWPAEIRLDPAKTTLTVAFENGDRFQLPAEYLPGSIPGTGFTNSAATTTRKGRLICRHSVHKA